MNSIISLLQSLIRTPSFSQKEEETAQILAKFLETNGILYQRKANNIWAENKYFDQAKPTILLNSHHDTVKPNQGYTRDPFSPDLEDNKLFGLGSNDAGGALVCLLSAFIHFYSKENLSHNLIWAGTAEEEISGKNGIELICNDLPKIEFAIVGEPTQMNLAIAEKGLMVLDCIAKGKSGHAAREEGINAIYEAMDDIRWFQTYKFPKISSWLGSIKMNVTMIQAGQQHNLIPEECKFTVDLRITDLYTHEEVLETVIKNIKAEVKPRSLRLRPSFISEQHTIVKAGLSIGRKIFGSLTTSDQALIPVPSVKIGPGDSARSHIANEFIFIDELEEGQKIYIQLLNKIL